MKARWLALSMTALSMTLLAGCKLDEADQDRQIIDVHARREGESVFLTVYVKNLGDYRGSKYDKDIYCVKSTWAQDGSIFDMEEACGRKELDEDHVDVVEMVANPVPQQGRVVIRLAMVDEDCPDCFQDSTDGEWTLLSP